MRGPRMREHLAVRPMGPMTMGPMTMGLMTMGLLR